MTLAALSVETLERIAFYSTGNMIIKLLFTGDRALRTKLSRSGELSFFWEKSSPCDWSAVEPLLSSFIRLSSLEIGSQWAMLHSKHPLDLARLPKSLSELRLSFCGCLDLLQLNLPRNPFLDLPNLTSLDLEIHYDVTQAAPARLFVRRTECTLWRSSRRVCAISESLRRSKERYSSLLSIYKLYRSLWNR